MMTRTVPAFKSIAWRSALGCAYYLTINSIFEWEEYQYWQQVKRMKVKLELLNSIPEKASILEVLTLRNLHDT